MPLQFEVWILDFALPPAPLSHGSQILHFAFAATPLYFRSLISYRAKCSERISYCAECPERAKLKSGI